MNDSSPVGAFLFFLLIVLAYLSPTLVALLRSCKGSFGGILTLNLLLGWTVLGWLIALIWAASAETMEQAKAKEFDYNKLAASMHALDEAKKDKLR
jgi:uncharacterized membrane protein YqaE (UPF0057 family)